MHTWAVQTTRACKIVRGTVMNRLYHNFDANCREDERTISRNEKGGVHLLVVPLLHAQALHPAAILLKSLWRLSDLSDSISLAFDAGTETGPLNRMPYLYLLKPGPSSELVGQSPDAANNAHAVILHLPLHTNGRRQRFFLFSESTRSLEY